MAPKSKEDEDEETAVATAFVFHRGLSCVLKPTLGYQVRQLYCSLLGALDDIFFFRWLVSWSVFHGTVTEFWSKFASKSKLLFLKAGLCLGSAGHFGCLLSLVAPGSACQQENCEQKRGRTKMYLKYLRNGTLSTELATTVCNSVRDLLKKSGAVSWNHPGGPWWHWNHLDCGGNLVAWWDWSQPFCWVMYLRYCTWFGRTPLSNPYVWLTSHSHDRSEQNSYCCKHQDHWTCFAVLRWDFDFQLQLAPQEGSLDGQAQPYHWLPWMHIATVMKST